MNRQRLQKTQRSPQVRNVRRFGRLAALGIAAVVCLGALWAAETALAGAESACRGLIQLRLSEEGISAVQLFSAIEGRQQEQGTGLQSAGASQQKNATHITDIAQPSYTAWMHSAGQKVSEPALGRTAQTDVIFCCGENSPRFSLPEGSCILPEETAYALWGTAEVEGYRLEICGEWYRVECVAAEGDAVVRMSGAQARRSGPAAFDRLELWLGGGAAGSCGNSFAAERALEQLLRLCQAKVQLTLRCDELLACMKAWMRLPFWAVAAWMAVRLFSASGPYNGDHINERKRFALQVLAATASLLLVWGLYRTVGLPVFIPQRCLPGAWSDLSFWTSAAKAAGGGLCEYLAQEHRGPDAVLLRGLWQTAIAGPVVAATAVMCLHFIAEEAWTARAAGIAAKPAARAAGFMAEIEDTAAENCPEVKGDSNGIGRTQGDFKGI